MITIDINCDLAEGGLFDAELMPLITSCNIACGGHFGTVETMTEAIKLAKINKVKIGAHPSYPDVENFGRKSMNISPSDLKESLKSQILKLKNIANFHDYPITHIKPHGALYNDANSNVEIAQLIVQTLQELNLNLPLFVAPNSKISKLAEGNNDMYFEGFSDRNYNEDYTLVSRDLPNAVIQFKDDVLRHVLNMVFKNRVEVSCETYIPIKVDTICMHSDTKNAVDILKYLRQYFESSSIKVKSYGN